MVTHGTVIALLVAAHNEVDGFDLWKRLACPSLVALTSNGYTLIDIASGPDGLAERT